METNRLSDNNVYIPLLDDEISLQEVKRSIKHLKHGKAAGADNILNEFISYGRDEIIHILVDLFNKLYDAGHYPTQWTTGVIVPIYKKRTRSNPANYRGITLTSTMSRIFTYILNERLLKWSELCCISTESQFAYKPCYSTIDAVFVLHSTTCISHMLWSLQTYINCAFIDFSKEFDKIDRSILYTHLMEYHEYAISSKMLQIIVDMYSKLKSQVRTNNGYTDTFPLDIR